MSIERIFYCDRDGCESHVRTAESRPRSGLIFLTDHPGPTLHFCGWDCVMKHAASFPPAEIIPFGPEESA